VIVAMGHFANYLNEAESKFNMPSPVVAPGHKRPIAPGNLNVPFPQPRKFGDHNLTPLSISYGLTNPRRNKLPLLQR